MAFCSRAEREIKVETPGCTTDKVGPGSYNVLVKNRNTVQSAAPFASNTQRSFGTATTAANAICSQPVNGRQADERSANCPQQNSSNSSVHSVCQSSVASQQYNSSSSSSFASSTKRFLASKEQASKPGPGTYQTAPKWAKHSSTAAGTRVEASKQVTSLLGSAVAAAAAVAVSAVQAAAHAGQSGCTPAVPLLTPPSIPARHQSYGYEEGPGGLLLMQPPPTTAAAAAAATAAADPADSTEARAAAAASSQGLGGSSSSSKGTWGASKTDRWASTSSKQPQPRHPRQQQQQQQQHGPDPCSYHVDSLATRFRLSPDGRLVPCRVAARGSFSAAGSAAFLSKVARLHQQEVDPDRSIPGPGAYQAQLQRPHTAPQPATGAGGFRPAHSTQPAQQQLFGRMAGRNSGGGLPRPSSVAPGPGAYDLSAAGALAKSVRSSRATLPAAAAAAARAAAMTGHADQDSCRDGSGHKDPCRAAGSGFGSTCSRFDDANSNSPGPGMYTADQVSSMSAEVTRKAAAASKRGAFGSAADRFAAAGAALAAGPEAAAAAIVPGAAASSLGPGCYDVDKGVAQKVAAAAVRPSPGFASASQRFMPAAAPVASPDYSCWDGDLSNLRGDAARLGPGAYVKLDEWQGKGSTRSMSAGGAGSSRRPAYHVAPFGSEAPRSSPGLAAANTNTLSTPGPGAYDNANVDMKEVFRPLSVPASNRAGFSAGSRRFASSSTVAPGPGAYAADVAYSCNMVRPSFNVTLDV